MIGISHHYKTIDEKESAIDRIFGYMDRKKVDISDYRVLTLYHKPDDIELVIQLGIRIQYQPGVVDEVKSWLIPV
jgi:hypothetical protein